MRRDECSVSRKRRAGSERANNKLLAMIGLGWVTGLRSMRLTSHCDSGRMDATRSRLTGLQQRLDEASVAGSMLG